jgi:hypothetical protein
MTMSNLANPVAPPTGTPDELRSYQMLVAGAYNYNALAIRRRGCRIRSGARAPREIGAEINPLLEWLAKAKSQAETPSTNGASPRRTRRGNAQPAESHR